MTTVPVNPPPPARPCCWALRMPSTPGNALAYGGGRARFADRPGRRHNPLIQGEEGRGAEEAIRYLRAKEEGGCEEGSPQGCAKPALRSSSVRARTCSFGRGVGLGRQSTGSCMRLPHPSVFWRSARGLPDAPHVRMDNSRFGENPPLDCYCYIF